MEHETSGSTAGGEKLTLIDSLITAMFIPKEYGKLLTMKIGNIIRYILVVVLLTSVIQYAIPVLGAIAGLGGMKSIVMNEIPKFSLEDGIFFLDEKIETINEEAGVYLCVDTTEKTFTKEDIPKDMIQVVMVSESNMLVYNSVYGIGGMESSMNFKEFKDFTINNQRVADMSGLIYAGFFIFFLVLWFLSIVKYLGIALFYGFFLYALMKGLMQELTFGMVYKITLFAMTIGMIMEAVTYCLGNGLLYMAGSFFNVMITIILINKAIVHCKLSERNQ